LNSTFFDTTTFSLPRVDLGKIWSLFKVTENPRFTYVRSIQDKDSDPREPLFLGTIYRDQKFGKEYFVVENTYEKEGRDCSDIHSIKEVVSSEKLSSIMTAAELKKTIQLKPADVDVENDMVDFFKKEATEAGMVFRDLRERNHGTGTQTAPSLASSLN